MWRWVMVCLVCWLTTIHTVAAQQHDDPTVHRHRSFAKAFEHQFNRFFDFNSYDTTFISPNRYNYAFMLTHNTLFERYKLSTLQTEQQQQISFAPNPSYKVGGYFGWRWIFIGWSVDVSSLFGKSNTTHQSDFTLNLYSSKIGVDLYYCKIIKK